MFEVAHTLDMEQGLYKVELLCFYEVQLLN